jgi:hypothetical protein
MCTKSYALSMISCGLVVSTRLAWADVAQSFYFYMTTTREHLLFIDLYIKICDRDQLSAYHKTRSFDIHYKFPEPQQLISGDFLVFSLLHIQKWMRI